MNYKSLFSILSIALVANLFSCKEKVVLDNTDLVPVVDNINTFFNDTTQLQTKTFFKDSIVTSYSRFMALGCIQDPTFGRTNAQFALEFALPLSNFNLSGDTLHVADSVFLYIPYAATYGNRKVSTKQNVLVYRLLDSLNKDTIYNNETVPYDNSKLLGVQTVDFNNSFGADDSIFLNKVKVDAGLLIKLDKNFADELVAQNKTDNFKTQSAFKNWLKGLYITVSDTTSGDNMGYFNIASARLALYYRSTNKTTLKQDTSYSTFPVNQLYCRNYNYISRNYFGSYVNSYINSSNSTDDLMFAQGEPGLVSTITFPNTASYQDYVINRAELLLNVVASNAPQFDSIFTKPSRLQALLNYNIGESDKIPSEYVVWGTNDGFLRRVKIGNDSLDQYRVNVTRSFQNAVLTGQTLTLKLFGIRDGYYSKNRVVLGGSTHSVYPAKLNLIYTKIKK